MGDWGERVALRVDGRDLTWADVWHRARADGSWRALEIVVREGKALQDAGNVPDGHLVQVEATAFRRARRLLAAEDIEAWLAARDLTVGRWLDHLGRDVLRRSVAAPSSRAVVRATPELMATGWCGGHFTAMARAAAVSVAGLDRWRPLDGDVARLVERRRLEWVRLEADVVVFRTDDVAREAMQCLVTDGMALADVASLAKATVSRWHGLIEDLDAPVRVQLLPAVPGDVIGPVPHGDGVAIFVIGSKELATASAPDVVERATQVLHEAEVERALTERVIWHEPR